VEKLLQLLEIQQGNWISTGHRGILENILGIVHEALTGGLFKEAAEMNTASEASHRRWDFPTENGLEWWAAEERLH
jgi:hypothetical protein